MQSSACHQEMHLVMVTQLHEASAHQHLLPETNSSHKMVHTKKTNAKCHTDNTCKTQI